MTFGAPELLVGLVLVPLALLGYLVVQRRRSRYAVRFTNVDLLANLVPRTPAWRRHVPPALYLAAITALAIGMARPSVVLPVPREEATIVLAVDISRSMLATDVEPTRLDAAKQAASDFVDQLPDDFRVGLVAFSTAARTVVDPTTNRSAVLDAIADLDAEAGTALGDAIALSVEAGTLGAADATATPGPNGSPGTGPAPSDDPADAGSGHAPVVATVLLSDGANSTGELEPIEAAEGAAAAGVPIYTIALGTDNGVVDVPTRDGRIQPLAVPPDPETLATVAELTGGRFFEAPTADDLAAIYESLGSRVGFVEEEQEITQLFAAGGLLFVLLGAGLAAHWFNRFP